MCRLFLLYKTRERSSDIAGALPYFVSMYPNREGLVAAGFEGEGSGLYLAREGRIALAEAESEALHAGEGREEALTDTPDDMLQEA